MLKLGRIQLVFFFIFLFCSKFDAFFFCKIKMFIVQGKKRQYWASRRTEISTCQCLSVFCTLSILSIKRISLKIQTNVSTATNGQCARVWYLFYRFGTGIQGRLLVLITTLHVSQIYETFHMDIYIYYTILLPSECQLRFILFSHDFILGTVQPLP